MFLNNHLNINKNILFKKERKGKIFNLKMKLSKEILMENLKRVKKKMKT